MQAARLTTREWTFVVSFTRVNSGMASEMATGGEGTVTCGAYMLLFGGCRQSRRGGGGRLGMTL
jgi:hypothetical protein